MNFLSWVVVGNPTLPKCADCGGAETPNVAGATARSTDLGRGSGSLFYRLRCRVLGNLCLASVRVCAATSAADIPRTAAVSASANRLAAELRRKLHTHRI